MTNYSKHFTNPKIAPNKLVINQEMVSIYLLFWSSYCMAYEDLVFIEETFITLLAFIKYSGSLKLQLTRVGNRDVDFSYLAVGEIY